MIYFIDIDGTICTNTHGDYEKAVPFLDRIAKINNLYESGHKVVYWTARGGTSGIDWSELTRSQLAAWGAKCDEIRMKKPSYDVWVDDKAFNSEEWFK